MIQFEFGETDQQSGLIQAIHGFLNSTSTLLVAILATKLSRKTLLIFGLITWSAATVASAFMRSYFLFLLLRCLVAFSEGFITTLGPVITSDLFNQPEERTAALTVVVASIPAGSGLGFLLGNGLANAFADWRISIAGQAILSLIG